MCLCERECVWDIAPDSHEDSCWIPFFIKTNRPHGQVCVTRGGARPDCVLYIHTCVSCLKDLADKTLSFPHTHSLFIERWGSAGEIHIWSDSCDQMINRQTGRQWGRQEHAQIHKGMRKNCINLRSCSRFFYYLHIIQPNSAQSLFVPPFLDYLSLPPPCLCSGCYTICRREMRDGFAFVFKEIKNNSNKQGQDAVMERRQGERNGTQRPRETHQLRMQRRHGACALYNVGCMTMGDGWLPW